MAIERKGNSTPAFRYFIFILFVCIFLFVFLMTRLIVVNSSAVIKNANDNTPAYRVELIEPFPIEQTQSNTIHLQNHRHTAA